MLLPCEDSRSGVLAARAGESAAHHFRPMEKDADRVGLAPAARALCTSPGADRHPLPRPARGPSTPCRSAGATREPLPWKHGGGSFFFMQIF